MDAVIHYYCLIVSTSLVSWLMCVLEAVVQKELCPCLHYRYFAPIVPNIDLELAGCGVLMGVTGHLRKITFGQISLGEIIFHKPSYKISEGPTSENVGCYVQFHDVNDKVGSTGMLRAWICVD